MKHSILKLGTILFALLLLSCDKDDNTPTQANNNQATIDGTTYQIKSGSLGLDIGSGGRTSFGNQFSLVFIDELIKVDPLNIPTVSTNTTIGIGVFVRLGSTRMNSVQAVVNNITTSTYVLGDDSSALTNISRYTNTYLDSGIQYGEIDDTGASSYEVNSTGNGTLTINSFSADLVARTATIDCSYTFTDENGKVISGTYNGVLSIHDDR